MHIQYLEPAFSEEGAYRDLNPRFAQIRDVLIDPVPAAWADEGGLREVEEFQFLD